MDLSLLTIPLLTIALVAAMIWGIGLSPSSCILQQNIRRMMAPRKFWSSRRQDALGDAQTLIQVLRSGEDHLLLPTDDQVQRLAAALAMAFFKLTTSDRVKVFFKPLESRTSSIQHLPNGKVAIFIHDGPHLLRRLSYTTSLVSLLLRELCVAFIILEIGCTIGGSSWRRQWWLLGEAGYGVGWLELAGTVHFRATTRLMIGDLNLEMKRKVRSEYIRSGLQPSEGQIDRFFDGEDPLIADDGVGPIRCEKKMRVSDRVLLVGAGACAGITLLVVPFSLQVGLV